MKLWKIIVFILLVVVAAFFFRTCRKTTYANFPPSATGEWVAFGDSLTSGVGASAGSDYPTLLSKELGRTILNKGVPGETTAHALRRIDEIVALQPKVVLLCLGGNDGLQHLPIDETFANISTMIDRLHAGGSFVVLIGCGALRYPINTPVISKSWRPKKRFCSCPTS